MGREHVHRVKSLILRSSLIKNKIFVESPPREGRGAGSGAPQGGGDMGVGSGSCLGGTGNSAASASSLSRN